jgi:hypothetical protein
MVPAALDAIETQKLPLHEEADDLLVTQAIEEAGLEEAGADGIEAPANVAGVEQPFARPDAVAHDAPAELVGRIADSRTRLRARLSIVAGKQREHALQGKQARPFAHAGADHLPL